MGGADRVTGRCKVAVIGAGNMAREHIRAFSDVPGVAVVGIYSRTRSKAEALAGEYGVPGVYSSVLELYEKTQADLLVVAVSEAAMKPVSHVCLEFPWTVLLEKPPGLNVSEAEELYTAAKSNGRKVLVALNRRFYSSTRAALTDLAQRQGPRFIKVQDQEDQVEALALGYPRVVVENWMYANSIHIVDYFPVFGRGKMTAVEPVFAWNPEDPGVVVSRIEFESGDIGLYEGVWNRPGPWVVSISTVEKRWEMRPLEQAAFQRTGQRRLEQAPVHPWDQAFKPGLRLQAQMAVAEVMGQSSDFPTLEDALETMRLIRAIYEPSQ